MWERSVRPVIAGIVLTVVVVIGGCGAGDGPTEATPPIGGLLGQRSGSTVTTKDMPNATWVTASTAPSPSDPRTCGQVIDREGAAMTVVVVTGNVSCRAAQTLMSTYHHESTDPAEDPETSTIDGWECVTDAEATLGPLSTCMLPRVGLVTAAPSPG